MLLTYLTDPYLRDTSAETSANRAALGANVSILALRLEFLSAQNLSSYPSDMVLNTQALY